MNAPKAPLGPGPIGSFFVIASTNAWVHVYRDVQSMLDSKDVGAGSPSAVEFFDVRGYRFAPVFSESWTLEELHQTGDRPDESAVRKRLGIVVDGLRAGVDARLAKVPNPPTREEALARLPDLNGKSLTECFDLLETDFGHSGGAPVSESGFVLMHDGSAWHNFWCH